jgi:hypothetical protein
VQSRRWHPGHDLAHAFLDGRDELVRNRATDDIVDELEPAAAVERLDAQIHLAELPGAAGLLLVAVMTLGRTADRLAVRHARRTRLDGDPIALADPLQHHAQVQVTEPVQHGLVLRRMMLDTRARVLGDEAMQRLGELLLLAALLGTDRDTQHCRREHDRLEVVVVLVVRIVQHRVEVQLVDLRDRAMSPGTACVTSTCSRPCSW